MTSLALFGFALFLCGLGDRLLCRSRWPERAPRLGIIAWLVLLGSAVVSVVLASVVLATPHLPATHKMSHGFSELLAVCATAFHEHYATPTGAIVGVLGAATAAIAAGRAAWGLIGVARDERRLLVQQHQHLPLVSRRHESSGVLVVDHVIPSVYCIPGRPGEIVVTTAALAALDHDHLEAVLAHERAHLAGRHHLIIVLATGLRRAFPRVPLFATAHTALRRLVEMEADDAAVRCAGRKALTSALLRLADGGTPTVALGAGNQATLDRVKRLARPAPPLGKPAILLAGSMSTIVLLAPISILAAPIAVAAVNCGLVAT